MEPCPICSQLKDIEVSFSKYAAPDYDRPLPIAAAKLVILPTLGASDPDKNHVRRCPLCNRLYRYDFCYEYLVNGSEDEEELTRMTPEQSAEYILAQVRRLETLRGEIEALEWNAGSLGDYIDRGRPSPEQEKEAHSSMQQYRQKAEDLCKRLKEQVESLRTACPEILKTWAEVHMRVCQSFLKTLPWEGQDAQVARFVAQETLNAWEVLPGGEESCIMVNTAWLEDYYARLEEAWLIQKNPVKAD